MARPGKAWPGAAWHGVAMLCEAWQAPQQPEGQQMSPREAALAVCGRAHTTDDARLLLTALGLLNDGQLAWPHPGLVEVRNIKQIAVTGPTNRRAYQ